MFMRTLGVFLIFLFTYNVIGAQEKDDHIDSKIKMLKKMINLTDAQSVKMESLLLELHKQTDIDREKFSGNNEALLEAAKKRSEFKKKEMKSFLNEEQFNSIANMMEKKKISEITLMISERLGLDCETKEKLDKILSTGPTMEEVIAVKKSKDYAKITKMKNRAKAIREKAMSLMNEEQKIKFRALREEQKDKVMRSLGN